MIILYCKVRVYDKYLTFCFLKYLYNYRRSGIYEVDKKTFIAAIFSNVNFYFFSMVIMKAVF